jgi:hypothetical protein
MEFLREENPSYRGKQERFALSHTAERFKMEIKRVSPVSAYKEDVQHSYMRMHVKIYESYSSTENVSFV